MARNWLEPVRSHAGQAREVLGTQSVLRTLDDFLPVNMSQDPRLLGSHVTRGTDLQTLTSSLLPNPSGISLCYLYSEGFPL